MIREAQLQRSAPEAQGITSTSILKFVEAAEGQIHELHSFMLLRHGSVVAEGWWSPYAQERPHMLFSLSKSFTSTAIGLCVMEQRLSIDNAVASFFPDDLPKHVSKNLAAMRVRDLLSMSSGHDLDTTDFMRQRRDGNWVKAFLKRPVEHEPGTHFVYNSGATYMLSAIVQKLTGMKLLDYLQPRLMQPLGIENATWEESPQGINTGGWGLNIKTEDIARFGQMYLRKGVWEGRRILDESWVEQASARQISNGSNPLSDWEQGYCFQFWRCRHNAYRGDGAFGQYCIVMPEQDAVLAITSGVPDMQAVLNLVWEHLLPALGSAPLAADAAGDEALARKLSTLALNPPQGKVTSPLAAKVSGRKYTAEANKMQVKSLALDFGESDCTLTVKTARGKERVTCEYGAWHEGRTALFDRDARIVASGVWTADDTFTLTARLFETPFFYTVTFHFTGDQLAVESDVNVSFVPQKLSLTAKAE